MPRSYQHVKKYEKEILELKEKGLILREIGEICGLTYDQIHSFIFRHNNKQRKILAGTVGIEINRKGRSRKDGTVFPSSI